MILNQSDYSFDASLKKIDFSSFANVANLELQHIKLITNVSNGNVIIYEFDDILLSGTYAANVLTLAFDTTAMNDLDILQIIIDDSMVGAVGGGLTDAELRATPVTVSASSLPLPTGAATELTLADILAKITADPATQTTLAALLAKVIAAPSTEAKQDSIIVLLTALNGYVDGLEWKDYATQTTLAAVLAKIIAAPATEAKQDSEISLLTSIAGYVDGLEAKDFATQTTLAAVLAKIIAAPATEAKQDTIIGHLDGVEGLLTTIDGDTGNISTKVDTLAGAVSGTEMQVDVITMPAVAVTADSIEDTGNSTVVALGSSANFTGTAFDMTPYASWSITIFSDKASSTNGLKVEWSNDGTNWDFSDQQTYAASACNMITFGRKAKWVRLNYTNTNSAQTFFRVAAAGQRFAVRQTRKFVGNQLVNQDTGQVVIAALQGLSSAGGGTWVDVKVNPSGALTTESTLAAGTANIGDVDVLTRPVATPNKTGSGTIVAIQTLATGAVVKGELAVTTKLGIALLVRIGRTVTTALTNPVKVRVEFSTEDSGDGNWGELFSLLSDTLASTTTSTLTTSTTAGMATLPMTATAGILIGDKLFIKDTVLANSEWSNNVITVNANTSVVIEDNMVINHAITTTQVWSKANVWACSIDVSRYRRIRVVFDSAYQASGQTVVVECKYVILDSIT